MTASRLCNISQDGIASIPCAQLFVLRQIFLPDISSPPSDWRTLCAVAFSPAGPDACRAPARYAPLYRRRGHISEEQRLRRTSRINSIPSFAHMRPNCVTGVSPRNCFFHPVVAIMSPIHDSASGAHRGKYQRLWRLAQAETKMEVCRKTPNADTIAPLP